MSNVPALTKQDALTGSEFHATYIEGAHDGCRLIQKSRSVAVRVVRVRRNGRTQTWKTRPDEWRLPVKYGNRARDQFSITQHEAAYWHTPASCPLHDI